MEERTEYKATIDQKEASGSDTVERRVISEFRPIVSLERIVNICVIKGLTQAHLIESFFKRKFKENEIDIKPDRQQISGALQRLSKAGKVERRQSMWRPVNL